MWTGDKELGIIFPLFLVPNPWYLIPDTAMNAQSLPILIVGSGAMACLFAARLSAAGVPVMLLGNWPEAVKAIRRDGIRLLAADGSARAYPVQVINGLELSAEGPASDTVELLAGVRYALVLVKSWQTGRAACQLAACLPGDGLALTLQNGIGNRETLAAVLGEQRVFLGVTTAGATLVAPGCVRPAGMGSVTLDAGPRLAPLAAMLRAGGFSVDTVPDADGLVWGKLVISAAINPLTALFGIPNGELLSREPARILLASAALEAAAVAAAQGVQLPYPDPVAAVEKVARNTASNHSSMLQDVQRGAPTEIDAICGAIVRAGQQSGIPTPVNNSLWQLVKTISDKGIGA